MKGKIFGFKTILTILLILLSIAITYLAKDPSPKIEVVHKEIDIKKK